MSKELTGKLKFYDESPEFTEMDPALCYNMNKVILAFLRDSIRLFADTSQTINRIAYKLVDECTLAFKEYEEFEHI